jgi:hypothetical protein
MSCEHWNASIVSRLYAELEPVEDERLSRHLEECGRCRQVLEDLAATRGRLREAEPVAPSTPRVVVLSPRPVLPRYLTFAAGIGCGALLLGIGVLAGRAMTRQTASIAGPARGAPVVAQPASISLETIDALRQRLDDQERRLRILATPPAESPSILTRQEYETALARLRDDLDQRQADHEQFLFDELRGVEARTGAQIGETREWLNLVMLASDPRINAQ